MTNRVKVQVKNSNLSNLTINLKNLTRFAIIAKQIIDGEEPELESSRFFFQQVIVTPATIWIHKGLNVKPLSELYMFEFINYYFC